MTAAPPGRDAWTRIYRIEGGTRRSLKVGEEDWEDLPQTDPDWADDGIWLSAGHSLVRLDPETGAVVRPLPGHVAHAPRRAGDRLFFSSNFDPATGEEGGTWRRLLVGTPDGGNLRVLHSTSIPIDCFDVAPGVDAVVLGLPREEAVR